MTSASRLAVRTLGRRSEPLDEDARRDQVRPVLPMVFSLYLVVRACTWQATVRRFEPDYVAGDELFSRRAAPPNPGSDLLLERQPVSRQTFSSSSCFTRRIPVLEEIDELDV